MKKSVFFAAFTASILSFQLATAQIAAKKGVTLEEVYKQLDALASKEDDASKAEMEKEAEALASSKNEDFVLTAVRIYDYLQNKEKSEKTNKSILKKFPKGKTARQAVYDKIFTEDVNVDIAEKEYQAWLKKFPASSFGEKERGIYDQALSKLAILHFRKGNIEKANAYVSTLKNSNNFPSYANTIAADLLKNNQSTEALPLLRDAYSKASSENSPLLSRIAPTYAQVLIEQGQAEKGISILEDLIKKNPSAATSANTLILAKAYSKEGKDLDAFLALEKFTVKNGKNDDVIHEIESLYNKLNNSKGNFQNYLANIEELIKESLTTKYKSEMVKKEAPQFSLTDRDGKTVSLADLKGKIVVLDFWATWCGPCKISFPGMQAAVNKYKEDNEVQFLFIDTWQREDNYKELVDEFIKKNNYTFHVLFDEMKDKDKATTTAYGVKGIPTKVIIDKEGFIRFESSGGSADVEKIVNEISTKIELARKG